jgi:hypothetical protein
VNLIQRIVVSLLFTGFSQDLVDERPMMQDQLHIRQPLPAGSIANSITDHNSDDFAMGRFDSPALMPPPLSPSLKIFTLDTSQHRPTAESGKSVFWNLLAGTYHVDAQTAASDM